MQKLTNIFREVCGLPVTCNLFVKVKSEMFTSLNFTQNTGFGLTVQASSSTIVVSSTAYANQVLFTFNNSYNYSILRPLKKIYLIDYF